MSFPVLTITCCTCLCRRCLRRRCLRRCCYGTPSTESAYQHWSSFMLCFKTPQCFVVLKYNIKRPIIRTYCASIQRGITERKFDCSCRESTETFPLTDIIMLLLLWLLLQLVLPVVGIDSGVDKMTLICTSTIKMGVTYTGFLQKVERMQRICCYPRGHRS